MDIFFGITFLLLVGVVAYFHYIQSAFSSVLSAIFAALASVLAFGYHQTIATLGGAPLAGYGDSVALVAIFAIAYVLMRVGFDRFVPGNLTLPVTLDRIVAVVGGLVAGVFCVGTAAAAVQILPFGTGIAAYSPYPTETKEQSGNMPGLRNRVTLTRYNELQVDRFDPTLRSNLILPIDKWTVALAKHVSDGGSMPGGNNLAQVSPNFLDDAFGQRLGLLPGAEPTLLVGVTPQDEASVEALFRIQTEIPQVDGELTVVRDDSLPKRYTPEGGKSLLVVRVALADGVGDADNRLRFAPAAARLAANRTSYYAIGTLTDNGVLVRNAPDDYLLAESDSEISLVFEVDADVFESAAGLLVEDALVVFKRYGRLPVGGATAGPFAPTTGDGMIRKTEVRTAIAEAGSAEIPETEEEPAEEEEPEAAEEEPPSRGIQGIRGALEDREVE